jgi:hypothetical protein
MPQVRYPTWRWPIGMRRLPGREIATPSSILAGFMRRVPGARDPKKRHSGGSPAPLIKAIRMPCWFLRELMPLGGELRKTTSTPINAQKARIDALVLRAPLDGMVLRRDGEVGEIVGPTDVLFWVGPPAPMQVVAEINEEEITRIAVGQKAFLRSEAFTNKALRATVSQITPKGDPTRKSFRVYLLLPRDTPLRIGMTVEVNIIYREKAAAVREDKKTGAPF